MGFKKGDIVEITNEENYNLWSGKKNSKWIVEYVMDECCSVKHIDGICSSGGININIRKEDLKRVGNIVQIAMNY